MRRKITIIIFLLTIILCIPLPSMCKASSATLNIETTAVLGTQSEKIQEPYWTHGIVVPEGVEEVIVPGFTPYSKIPSILHEFETTSDRVKVEVIGKSAWGNDIFLVTVAKPTVLQNLEYYKFLSQLIAERPELAQKLLEKLDYKLPIYIHASIHGSEFSGTDAALDLIEYLAYSDDEEVNLILEKCIIIINVCANPDGRIAGTRGNGNGFDLNRDWIHATQPETRCVIEHVWKEWNPIVNLDLHGFMGYDWVLIEPCTRFHNPNFEGDLLYKHLLPMAEFMEAKLAEIGIDTVIPYRDREGGWDDYPPIFTPMYGFYHACYGVTFETNRYWGVSTPESSIRSHYVGSLAAIIYTAEHAEEMLKDKIKMFLRGIKNENHWLRGEYGSFPYAYIIPMSPELQMDLLEAARFVDHLIFHGVKVWVAVRPFEVGGVVYPKGTYVVLMEQPRAGLANVMLWYGEDLSWDLVHVPYDIYAWNFPELWGFTRVQVTEPFEAKLVPIRKAYYPRGGIVWEYSHKFFFGYYHRCGTWYFALKDNTNNAVVMVNRLLGDGYTVYRTAGSFGEFPAGTFIIEVKKPFMCMLGRLLKYAHELHLTLYAIEKPEIEMYQLREPKIAVLYDRGIGSRAHGAIIFVLREVLEFKYVDTLDYDDVREGKLAEYDVVIVPDGSYTTIWSRLDSDGQQALLSFIENGGTCIGVGEGGGALVNLAGFIDAVAHLSEWYGGDNNGIFRLEYNYADPSGIAAYYPAEGYAYGYWPVWFEPTGENYVPVASYASENVLLAGWWPGYEDCQGFDAIVYGEYGSGNVVLMGIEPTFRAYPEFTFRLIANAIFLGAS